MPCAHATTASVPAASNRAPATPSPTSPGSLVGHASHAPDNTGVTVIVPRAGRDTWLEPVYAGVAVLNGAGELTGSIQIREWGLMETPVFLTGTPYVGAVYDAATRVLMERQPRIGVDDVVIPVVGEYRPELDRRRRARAGARRRRWWRPRWTARTTAPRPRARSAPASA